MIRVILIGIVIFASIPSPNFISASTGQPTGKVIGTVMDLNEAVIPRTQIVITGENIERRLTSNEEGSYEIDLPAGAYNVTAKANGFRPFQRAAFRVQPNSTLIINIVPLPLASDVANPPIYSDSFSLPNVPHPPIKLFLEYMKKRNHKRFWEYSNVMASFDALMIQAGIVRLDKKTYQLVAEGNVVIDDGKKRVHVRNAKVNFKGGVPIIITGELGH